MSYDLLPIDPSTYDTTYNIQMANTTGKSHLLNCPPEIRNIIYGYVLSYDNVIVPYCKGSGVTGYCTPDSTFLALLQVSKSVEREAAPIFFKQNLFQFDCWYLAYKFPYFDTDGFLFPHEDQIECPIINNVPERYIIFLRNVNLYMLLTGNKRKCHEILEVQSAINCLAARSTILRLSITLVEQGEEDQSEWDPDPFSTLRALDDEKCISTAVGKLANLGRLEIKMIQGYHHRRRPLRVSGEWTVQLLNRVKVEYFAKAKAVRYSRQAEPYSVTDEFSIDF